MILIELFIKSIYMNLFLCPIKNLKIIKIKISFAISEVDNQIISLSKKIKKIWKKNEVYFFVGMEEVLVMQFVANDMIYGIGMGKIPGMNVEALSANSSVITCLANDTGYENIFSKQIEAKGKKMTC